MDLALKRVIRRRSKYLSSFKIDPLAHREEFANELRSKAQCGSVAFLYRNDNGNTICGDDNIVFIPAIPILAMALIGRLSRDVNELWWKIEKPEVVINREKRFNQIIEPELSTVH